MSCIPATHIAFGFLLMGFIAAGSRADEPVRHSRDEAIKSGLDSLAAQQNPDGSFGTRQVAADTALALMSFLASGHAPHPGDGKYGSNANAALDSLLKQFQTDGSIGQVERPVYGQAIATLALAEAYGVDDNEARRKHIAAVLTSSVKLILAAQTTRKPDTYGGWRNDASSADSDLPTTAWNLMALRACQDVGIAVQKGALARALKFVLKCYNAEGKGFSNQPHGPVQMESTATALVCLHALEADTHPEFDVATSALSQEPLLDAPQDSNAAGFFRLLAAFHAGKETWNSASAAIFDKLLKSQQSDGGWPEASNESPPASRACATSLALLSLSISCNLLPAYQ